MQPLPSKFDHIIHVSTPEHMRTSSVSRIKSACHRPRVADFSTGIMEFSAAVDTHPTGSPVHLASRRPDRSLPPARRRATATTPAPSVPPPHFVQVYSFVP